MPTKEYSEGQRIRESHARKLIQSREWRLSNLYQIRNKQGEVIQFVPNWTQKMLLKPHYLNLVLKARQLGVCLDPDTKILKADLTWIRIGDALPDDEIVSVDEYSQGPGRTRHLRKGIVEAVVRHIKPCYRITFDNGKTLICTGQHPWLSMKSNIGYDWRSIEAKTKKKLLVGSKIRRIVTDTWVEGDFEDGWMGGMLDGEGSLALKSRLGGSLSVSQVEGRVLDRAIAYLQSRGYNYRFEEDKKPERPSKFGSKPVQKLVVSRIDEMMKLIGTTRPSRFLERDWWEGKELPCLKEGPYSTITNIEFIGDHEVVDLQTSMGTYIAEGYVSHNTTYFSLMFLDTCLFNDNVHAAIIADNRPTAREIFVDKVKFAYDNLPEWVRKMTPAFRDNVNELRFENGSVFRVGTSLRGGTVQLLHITEFAKICIENPNKAAEIMSGALNTVQMGQFVTIESTARGREGFFYDLCRSAKSREESGLPLGPLDWKMWFFPWYMDPAYTVNDPYIVVSGEMSKYFDALAAKGILLSEGQKAWYIKKNDTQCDYMKREYPSTWEEAFESANEGFYFSGLVTKARSDRRICHLPPDEHSLKFSAWDIGINDATAIWIFEVIGKEIHFIDYYENSGEPLSHYVKWIREHAYDIDRHFMPFDAAAREKATGKGYEDFAREAGLKVELLERSRNELVDIETVRYMFPKLWFDQSKCAGGLKAVENFRKEYNEKLQCFRERSLHNWASNGTKGMIYAIQAVNKMTGSRCLTSEEWSAIRAKYT